jgi:HEAT repeat protein
MSERGSGSGEGHPGQGDSQLFTSAGSPSGKTNTRDRPIIPGIPDPIAKDLDSSDARVRLQALNHWAAPQTTAPLDPLYEALEDEDETVRAKATEIVERRWAAEQGQN